MKSFYTLLALLTAYSFEAQADSCRYSDPNACEPGSYCTYIERDKAQCMPLFLLEPLKVEFPFHSHHKVTCDQGNESPDGNSHTYWNTHYALDLHTDQNGPGGSLFSGVSGIAIVFNECLTINDDCGAGFGNHVKILTPDGFLVQYAHLSHVNVKTGRYVQIGDLIGREGHTGATGENNPHLHLSVHYDWREMGFEHWKDLGFLPPSVPFLLEHRRANCEGSSCRINTLSTEIACIRKENYSFDLQGYRD